MGALADVFGIDWKLLVIQIINFSVLLGALSYFLYRPILALLDERKKIIEKGVSDAEAAAAAKESAELERTETVGKAVAEAAAIIDSAKKEAGTKGTQMIHEASLKSEQIVKDAEAAAEEAKRRTVKEAEAEIAKMIVLGIEKTVREKK